jgi:predicted Co/Zn/Cd cation transporter (cation efflux family)
MDNSDLIEEKALKISMVGAFLLAVWGIVMAVVADSGVILLDGMFNLISGIMSFFSIEITRLISGKETREYPLGYFAFESLFVFVKGASILILVLMALYANIKVLLSGGREPALGVMTIYVALAVIGCTIIYLITRKSLKQTGSDILAAESRAWLVNAVISGAIGIAFGVVMLIQGTAWGWIDRYADQVLVIVLSILVIKDPLVLMKNGLKELLLAAPQRDYAAPYEDKILPLKAQLGANQIGLEILKTGRRIWVTVRLDPKSDTINVDEFMKVKKNLSKIACSVYPNSQTEVMLERPG